MELGARTVVPRECRAAQERCGPEAEGGCSPGRVPRLCCVDCDHCGSHTSQGQ